MRKSIRITLLMVVAVTFVVGSGSLFADAEEYTMMSIPKLRATWFDRMEVGLKQAGEGSFGKGEGLKRAVKAGGFLGKHRDATGAGGFGCRHSGKGLEGFKAEAGGCCRPARKGADCPGVTPQLGHGIGVSRPDAEAHGTTRHGRHAASVLLGRYPVLSFRSGHARRTRFRSAACAWPLPAPAQETFPSDSYPRLSRQGRYKV